MILSDRDIKKAISEGRLGFESPYGIDNVLSNIKGCSVDFRLGNDFKIYEHASLVMLDPNNKDAVPPTRHFHVEDDKPFIVQPGEFVLGITAEKILVPEDMVVLIEGRSSLGRLGLIIHSTAGFINPGFEGKITLEITNINRLPIALYPGMRIGQFIVNQLSSPADISYKTQTGAKYANQELPGESKISVDTDLKAA